MQSKARPARRIVGARPPALLAVVAALLIALVGLVGATPARADASGVQDWLNRINGLRAAHGLNALILDANLSDLAQQRAQINASTGQLVHTPNLALGVTSNWTKLGENIGAGQDHDGLWTAFLNSPPHLANLLDPSYTHVGIGEVSSGPGNDWVTHRFMRVATPAPPAAAPVYVAPAPTSTYSTPPTQAPAPRSTSRTNGGGSSGPGSTGSSGSNTSNGSTSTSGTTSTVGPSADTAGGDGSSAGIDGPETRSPDHVAAVINVLQALEQ
jgi:hypothetical protein